MKDDRPSDPLARLGERLDKARRQRAERAEAKSGSAAGFGLGLRIGIELVSALAVGVGLGYLADRFIGTRPWGVIVGFFLGAAAGMVNALRAMREMEGRGSGSSSPDGDDDTGRRS